MQKKTSSTQEHNCTARGTVTPHKTWTQKIFKVKQIEVKRLGAQPKIFVPKVVKRPEYQNVNSDI
jgi:hypothetical protein